MKRKVKHAIFVRLKVMPRGSLGSRSMEREDRPRTKR